MLNPTQQLRLTNLANVKLAPWELDVNIFIQAAQQGFIERAQCTKFDPITMPGTDAWRYPTQHLRRTLHNHHGWRVDDPSGLPLIISDKHKINITVSSGDEATGLEHSLRLPRTKNPKGSIMKAAVERNINQPSLFPHIESENIREFPRTASYPTWIFLLFITDDKFRAELSLPSKVNDADYIVEWDERIIIPVTLPAAIGEGEGPEDGPDITPDITLKV